MLKRKTLLVVGAGASKEFNLPIGFELMRLIQDRLSLYLEDGRVNENNRDLLESLLKHSVSNGKERGQYIELARIIRDGLHHAKSIDNFIRTHNADQDLVFVCKLAIADVIAQCERNSTLMPSGIFKPYFGPKPRSDTWLEVLARNLFAELEVNELSDALTRLRIVCFNYDRCIEVFLRKAIQDYFLVDIKKAQALTDNIQVTHPYGSLGSIWGVDGAVGFAESIDTYDVLSSAKKIRTFHEGVADPSIAAEIRESLAWADSIVFLGFGYLQQNMELIRPVSSTLANSRKAIFATVYELSEENKNMAHGAIESLLHNGNFSIASIRSLNISRTCTQLLDAHRAELFGF